MNVLGVENMKIRLLLLLLLSLVSLSVHCQKDVFGNRIPAKKRVIENPVENHTDARGRKQGQWQKFYPNGSVAYRARFVDDLPVDTLVRFYPQGQKMADIIFGKEDQPGVGRFYNRKGKVTAQGFYRGMQKDSIWTYFNDGGDMVSREIYKTGKQHGKTLVFFSSGSVAVETNYAHGLQTGEEKHFFPGGTLQRVITWQDGKRHGDYRLYNTGGILQIRGGYNSGKRDGKWLFYNEKGEKDYELLFNKGEAQNTQLLDSLQQAKFIQFEQNSRILKDPADFQNNPGKLF